MKQKSFDLSSGDWILYLDADERVSPQLSAEIKKVINMDDQEIEDYQTKLKNKSLFQRHQRLLEQRDGAIGAKDGENVAFFFPRRNFHVFHRLVMMVLVHLVLRFFFHMMTVHFHIVFHLILFL